MAEQASLSGTWSETPEDIFSHGVAQICFVTYNDAERHFIIMIDQKGLTI